MVEKWKNQYDEIAKHEEQIAKLQSLSSDLKNEMKHVKESIDELNENNVGSGRDQIPHNVGNNFVSINFDGNYQKRGSDS